MKFKKSDLGRSMLEVLLYIALIGAISGTSFKMYADYSHKIKRIETIDTIKNIRDKINAIYFGRKSGDTNEVKQKLQQNNVNTKTPIGTLDFYVGGCIDVPLSKLSKEDCIYFCMSELQSDCEGYYNTPNATVDTNAKIPHDCIQDCNKDGNKNQMRFYFKRSNMAN